MLSYRHTYHAGGPADVHKHVALCLLLEHMAKKERAFCVIDLYAGDGLYDLSTAAAQKTKEYKDGIGVLWKQALDAPPAIKRYLSVLREFNPGGKLHRYPGSPALARAMMRTDDRLMLNELHSTAYTQLKRWVGDDARITVHKRDGLEALVGLTPPKIRRGLALIDPSYEVKTEYASVAEKLAKSVQKWAEGIFAVWYPVLHEGRHRGLIDSILAQVKAGIFACELSMPAPKRGEETEGGLRGTGLLVVNPPWQFDAAMSDAGAWIAKNLTHGKHTATWLKRPAG